MTYLLRIVSVSDFAEKSTECILDLVVGIWLGLLFAIERGKGVSEDTMYHDIYTIWIYFVNMYALLPRH